MKKLNLILLLFISINSFSQKNLKIELTKSYELGNIILALTEYGRADPLDVQKPPYYHNEILEYFKPVQNHPLLDSVNYSRKDWEKFLGFRTDFYAFSFDKNGKLKRDYPFNSFGPTEVDKNINLINDFVQKSNYLKFYNLHKDFYSQLKSNYKEHYFIDKSFSFLDNISNIQKNKVISSYAIAISPLVGGQNCHRNIDSLTTVDFPNISRSLIEGRLNEDIEKRVTDNHTIFTEINHGYIDPISHKYSNLILKKFDFTKWDKNSGYPGISIFNEYMTWAVYDLFIHENFPEVNTDNISNIYWKTNYQRGFIAQNIFSKQLLKLFKESKTKQLESIYKPMLEWCKKVENNISQPQLLNSDTKNYIKLEGDVLNLQFSEPMTECNLIDIILYEFKDGNQTKSQTHLKIKNPTWSNNSKTVSFKLKTDYNRYAIGFYVWNNINGLYSKNEILLNPQSYIMIKK